MAAPSVLRSSLARIVGLALLVVSPVAAPLTLSGELTNAGANYSIAELQALPATTVTVGADTFVGVSLWTLLGGTSSGASNIITTGGGNNAILRSYVLGTSAGGTQTLLSVGEINAVFGGTGAPTIVAYERNGTLLGTSQLVVPADLSRSRYLADLLDISVLSVPRPPVGPGGPSTSFTVSGGSTPKTYDLAGLQALPATTAHDVTFMSGGTQTPPNDFTGPALWTLLSLAGIGDQDILTGYVLATGTDGYQVLFSLGELYPGLGGRLNMVAYADSSGLLLGNGFARIVVPGDLRGGRFVSNLTSFTVANAIPEPESVAMLAAGLIALAVYVRRRVRS